MTSDRRIVFIDVDGTIIDHDEVVPASTVAAIRGARAAGHLVYLCTGRAHGDVHPDVAAIGFDGAVTNGGTTAHVGDTRIVSRLMPADAVERMVTEFASRGYAYFLQTDDEVFADSAMREFARLARVPADPASAEDSLSGIAHRTYRDVSHAAPDDVAKGVFVSLDPDAVGTLDSALGEEFHVVPGSMPFRGATSGEICMRGTNKGSAIELVLAHLRLDAATAIGIGDSWNDVEMFEVCGTSIAMGNAHEPLKALADHVTTNIRDDGVWNAFVTAGLIPVG